MLLAGLRDSTELRTTNAGDAFDPRSVVSHPHVYTGHIRVGAADAVRYSAAQRPSTVFPLEHQWSSAIPLRKIQVSNVVLSIPGRW